MPIEPARQEALASGATRYFTGKPCKYGHIAPRYVTSRHCVLCVNRRNSVSARKHIDRVRAARRARYAADPSKAVAKQARYRARKLEQLCACCTPGDIRAVYRVGHLLNKEVDHIIPLVYGGLHCCKNLQLLTKAEHCKKTGEENRRRFQVAA